MVSWQGPALLAYNDAVFSPAGKRVFAIVLVLVASAFALYFGMQWIDAAASR